MNTINLLLVASALLSLAFAYIPGLKDKYDALDPTRKRLVMAGSLLLATAGIYGYGCAGRLADFTCDANAAWDLATSFVLAIMANQTTYELLGKFGKTAEVSLPVYVKGEPLTSLSAVYGTEQVADQEVTVEAEVEND